MPNILLCRACVHARFLRNRRLGFEAPALPCHRVPARPPIAFLEEERSCDASASRRRRLQTVLIFLKGPVFLDHMPLKQQYK